MYPARKTCTKATHYMTRGKTMIAEFESRILALIDNMVDPATESVLPSMAAFDNSVVVRE
jgi:hypothetical protein